MEKWKLAICPFRFVSFRVQVHKTLVLSFTVIIYAEESFELNNNSTQFVWTTHTNQSRIVQSIYTHTDIRHRSKTTRTSGICISLSLIVLRSRHKSIRYSVARNGWTKNEISTSFSAQYEWRTIFTNAVSSVVMSYW